MATFLDPEIDPHTFPVGTITANLLAELRNSNLRLTPELSGTVEQTAHEIDAKTGVTVTVHRPAGLEEPAPALFWIHGGGYVMGSVDTDAVMFDRRRLHRARVDLYARGRARHRPGPHRDRRRERRGGFVLGPGFAGSRPR
ncbi:MAG: hypothetical protein P8I99_04160 [Acidimicrobiales bacterium]|nr:hypothetical protein [Acidimicrobiales bacterium]MDG1876596.1 hypothetical protein [Acidimicrobiales bacterium]